MEKLYIESSENIISFSDKISRALEAGDPLSYLISCYDKADDKDTFVLALIGTLITEHSRLQVSKKK